MDLASVVAALASVGVRVSGSTPNNSIQGDSSRACPTGLAGPEPSGTHNDPGQHFQRSLREPEESLNACLLDRGADPSARLRTVYYRSHWEPYNTGSVAWFLRRKHPFICLCFTGGQVG